MIKFIMDWSDWVKLTPGQQVLVRLRVAAECVGQPDTEGPPLWSVEDQRSLLEDLVRR